MLSSLLEGEGAIIVVVYMVQQINCIRNKEGDIVEVRIYFFVNSFVCFAQ